LLEVLGPRTARLATKLQEHVALGIRWLEQPVQLARPKCRLAPGVLRAKAVEGHLGGPGRLVILRSSAPRLRAEIGSELVGDVPIIRKRQTQLAVSVRLDCNR
jgi:hypothetical protein